MADGGYPKTWRHYINTTTFIDAGERRKRIITDMAEMEAQLVLSPAAREAIVGASDKLSAFFSSMTPTKPLGEERLLERAGVAVNAMEAALIDAEEKDVGF